MTAIFDGLMTGLLSNTLLGTRSGTLRISHKFRPA
jgi:hypothetical protein